MSAAPSPTSAGLLLTGGASRRMGRPKASLVGAGGETLARRTARFLMASTAPAFEIGPGFSGLAHLVEEPPGGGPLVAIVCGRWALTATGWQGPALVVATDLPRLTAGLVEWLASHPSPASMVPVSGGRPQMLCARYSAADLAAAEEVVAAGGRSMRDLLAAIRPELLPPEEWRPIAGNADALADADAPADLHLLGQPHEPGTHMSQAPT